MTKLSLLPEQANFHKINFESIVSSLIKNAKSEIQKSKNRRIEFRFLLGDPSDNFIIKLLLEQ